MDSQKWVAPILLGGVLLGLVGCNSNNEEIEVGYLESISFDLSASDDEWVAGFADYPVNGEVDWELSSSANEAFTLATGEAGSGYFLHSMNRSDDTQMYITRKISGLKPSTHFDVAFDIQMATSVNDQCVGIGGAPHSVTVKAALSRLEPKAALDSLDHYRLNIDTGSQVNGGLDAQSLGNIGLESLQDCDPGGDQYGLKNFNNEGERFEVTSDENGELWLTLLTDSGFEGPTSIYFTKADLSFSESTKSPEGFSVSLDFAEPQDAVSVVFYDYPIGREFEWELTAQPESEVTLEQGGTTKGYLLHSYNRSDDTGMLLHTPVKGFLPNTAYSASFKMTIATNVNNMCFGIGGAPHSVAVKAGVSLVEPQGVRVENDNHLRLNFDLGNNMAEGEYGVTLGDIGSETLTDCDPSSSLYALKSFDSEDEGKTLTITTNDQGVLYFSIATDSGFEGATTMLFTEANVTFSRVQ